VGEAEGAVQEVTAFSNSLAVKEARSMESRKLKVAIIGATGYTGGELVRLLLQHPNAEIAALLRLSSEDALPLHKAHPHLRGLTKLECVPYDDSLLDGVDAAFLAVPNGVAMELAPKLLEKGVKVIDLSADFRFRNHETYERWYRKSIPQNTCSPKRFTDCRKFAGSKFATHDWSPIPVAIPFQPCLL
jgi:hypothetical protein